MVSGHDGRLFRWSHLQYLGPIETKSDSDTRSGTCCGTCSGTCSHSHRSKNAYNVVAPAVAGNVVVAVVGGSTPSRNNISFSGPTNHNDGSTPTPNSFRLSHSPSLNTTSLVSLSVNHRNFQSVDSIGSDMASSAAGTATIAALHLMWI